MNYNEQISLCPHCSSMTKTLLGICGKCKKDKLGGNVYG